MSPPASSPPSPRRVTASALAAEEKTQRPKTFEFSATPLIIEGIGEEWPLVQRARQSGDCLQTLVALIGNEPVRWTEVVRESAGPVAFGYDASGAGANFDVGAKEGPFSAFAHVLKSAAKTDSSSPLAYLQAMPVRSLPAIADAIFAFDFMLRHVEITTGLWVGSGEHVSQLHYDFFHNFLCVVEGEKHVWLHPFVAPIAEAASPRTRAERFGAMKPGPFDTGPGDTPGSLLRWDGSADGHGGGDAAFALDATASTALLARLKPGDMLYIPPFYWHAVSSLGRNVMINSWTATGVPEGFQALPMILDGVVAAAQTTSRAERNAFAAVAERGGLLEIDCDATNVDIPQAFVAVTALIQAVVGAAERVYDQDALNNAFTTLAAFYAVSDDTAAIPPAMIQRVLARTASRDAEG